MLLVHPVEAQDMDRRVVITFKTSMFANEYASLKALENTYKVKEYGRRLVLDILDDNIENTQILVHYGGYSVIESIEEDAIVNVLQSENIPMVQATGFNNENVESNSINVDSNSMSLETSILNSGGIEWQFAAGSEYGMQVERLWKSTNGSVNTRIAVIDSGIAAIARTNNWFQNLETGYDFISHTSISIDNDGRDPNPEDPGDEAPSCPTPTWHGTKMAFSIAGKHNAVKGLHSMAWNTTIQPIRVLGVCSYGYANDVTDAIVWAAGGMINGLGQNPNPAHIISMSFGGQGKCPSYLQSAISMAVKQFGVIVIAAAGNNAQDVSNVFPANCEGVFSVGASTFNGEFAQYSNFGSKLAVVSPGGNNLHPIQTVKIEKNTNEVTITNGFGTSYSAAYVTGFIALIFEYTQMEINPVQASFIDLQISNRKFNMNDVYTHETCYVKNACSLGILNVPVFVDTLHEVRNSTFLTLYEIWREKVELYKDIQFNHTNESQVISFATRIGSKIRFTYTGTFESWIVPPNVEFINIKMWGGGGGGSAFRTDGQYKGGSRGGCGGFTSGKIPVTSGQYVYFMVAQG